MTTEAQNWTHPIHAEREKLKAMDGPALLSLIANCLDVDDEGDVIIHAMDEHGNNPIMDRIREVVAMNEPKENKMIEYKFNVAMDARVYGVAYVKAETPEAAKEALTAEIVADTFTPHGGSGDIDYQHPSDIYCDGIWTTDDDDGELVDFGVKDGPWTLRPVSSEDEKVLNNIALRLSISDSTTEEEDKALQRIIDAIQ